MSMRNDRPIPWARSAAGLLNARFGSREDAAAGYNSPSLTSIVYVGRNQLVPGMLNFRDALAYGPTYYKGHPLRIRFTVLVLQKEKSDKAASAVDVVGTIASAAVPGYGALIGEAAKGLKALLKAQKDVVAFDFELTMLADRPEEFRTPIPTGPTAQGHSQDQTPANALVYSQPHWLRYGDYLIMETIDRNRSQNLVNDVLGNSLQFKNGRLTRQNQLVPANYLAFRITPNQKAEEDQTLAAASQANATFLKSIQRSAEDVKTAMDDLQNAAKSLQGEVLSIRAKSLARATANRVDAMHLTADAAKAEFTKQFTNRWSTLIGGLDAETQKTAKAIGETISLRFADQYSPTPAAAAGDVASDLSSKLIDKSVTVNERPFTIASAPIKLTAEGNLPNTIPLTLKPDASSLHVKKADLRLALVTLCDKEAKKLSSAARIDSVTIQNESAIPNLDD